MTKIETYGGFDITYDEDASQFVATHAKDKTATPLRSKELKPLRTRIDNFNDPQEKKKREQPKYVYR